MSQPINATSLADLGEVLVIVPVTRPDGQVVNVPLKTLGEAVIWRIRRSIAWPKPPIKDYQKKGGEVTPILDYQDEGYRKAVDEADRLLAHKALLASLAFDVPGETEEDKLAEIERVLGKYASDVLIAAVNRINIVSAEEIAAIARSFRPARTVGAPSNGAAGPHALDVANPSAEREARAAGLPADAG